jgi:hypothetical protein
LPSNLEYLCSVIGATCAFIGGAFVDEALIKEGAHLKVH